MNTEERIRHHLEQTTAPLRAPDRLDRVMAEGRRRKMRNRAAGVLGAAALLAAAVGVLGALQPATPQVADTSSPTSLPPDQVTSVPATTVPVVDSALGVVVAGPEGIEVLDANGSSQLHLTSPDPYGEIAVAYPDGRGGLVYQHATTPLPWEPQSILWLRAGSESPSVLTAAPEGGSLVIVGTAHTEEGPVLYYLQQSPGEADPEVRLLATNLDRGTTTEVTSLGGRDVTAGGNIAALMDRSDLSCTQVTFVDISGSEVESPLSDECLNVATGVAVSANGNTAAFLNGGQLVVRVIATGEVVLEREIPGAYMVTGGQGGWAVRTEEETVLIGSDGSLSSLPPVQVGTVVPFAVPFELSESARLGPETEETGLPCTPTSGDLVDQDLPAPVAETRQQLFELASACDYEGLAAIVEAHGANFTFGDNSDPVEHWVREGRSGEEPLSLLARLLQTEPAYEAESGRWVWPAVFLDPSNEAAWEQVGEFYDPELAELMRDAGEYLGHRVGIGDDGQWMFYVAGD